MTDNALIIMMRAPVAGKVKSRLAATIGDKAALEVYEWLLDITASVTSKVQATRLLFHTGGDPDISVWPENLFRYFPQKGNDLGERMLNAFNMAFSLGAKKVMILGTDCPGINESILNNGFKSLDHSDLVIGPANDGGYYLLGMNKICRELFTDMPWSTDKVFSETISIIAKSDLAYLQLETLNDIDTEEDLKNSGINLSEINQFGKRR